MNNNIADEFLLTCKQNRFDNITPANTSNYSKEGYIKIVDIAKAYFKKGKYKEFSDFFQEGHYLIPLWAAHMLIEYGIPSKNLKLEAMRIIKEYSDNPLAPEVAEEEKEWLRSNEYNYKE